MNDLQEMLHILTIPVRQIIHARIRNLKMIATYWCSELLPFEKRSKFCCYLSSPSFCCYLNSPSFFFLEEEPLDFIRASSGNVNNISVFLLFINLEEWNIDAFKGDAQFVQKVTFNLWWSSNKTIMEVGNITKAVNSKSFLHLSYKTHDYFFYDSAF